jgi:hypothetical protein
LPPKLFKIIFIGPAVGSFPRSLTATSWSWGYHKAFGRWKLARSLLKKEYMRKWHIVDIQKEYLENPGHNVDR